MLIALTPQGPVVRGGVWKAYRYVLPAYRPKSKEAKADGDEIFMCRPRSNTLTSLASSFHLLRACKTLDAREISHCRPGGCSVEGDIEIRPAWAESSQLPTSTLVGRVP